MGFIYASVIKSSGGLVWVVLRRARRMQEHLPSEPHRNSPHLHPRFAQTGRLPAAAVVTEQTVSGSGGKLGSDWRSATWHKTPGCNGQLELQSRQCLELEPELEQLRAEIGMGLCGESSQSRDLRVRGTLDTTQ